LLENTKQIFMKHPNTTSIGVMQFWSDGVLYISSVGNGTQFRTGASSPSNAMKIDSSGNVGIGTDSPNSLLEFSTVPLT